MNDYDYVLLNPLKAKKEINQGLRRNKTDRNDAYHLALAKIEISINLIEKSLRLIINCNL
ncbi:hypothetical protein FET70_03162 (plasmid) [Lactiplantibacillus plantarum]|nr:hypothetical protein FET70_03162 [Lactiplantibacillus plantarum]